MLQMLSAGCKTIPVQWGPVAVPVYCKTFLPRGRILEHNWDKSQKSFFIFATSTTGFYPPPPPHPRAKVV
jgi:hypothetical protein